MKTNFNLILISFLIFFLFTNKVFSEDRIVYLDMQKVMNISKAGKSIRSQLEKKHKKNINNFKKEEEELKNEESKIVSQKKLLQNEDYQKKINELRVKVKKYREKRTNDINKLTKQRVEATKKLLDTINPILVDYSKEKSIAMIVQKKNIVIGKSELDITDDIIELVNKKISTIKLN